ncbi:MAG: Cof-type HAD-IIB family hydrolase [Sarcina sp.]
MYKLVAIDMDGTLLNSEKIVSERNRQAIKEAVEKGAMVVISTGRGFIGIEKYLNELGLDKKGQYALTMNGGAAYDCYTKQPITNIGIKGSDLHRIHKMNEELGLKIQAYTLDKCVALEENEYTDFEKHHVGTEVQILDFYKDIDEDDDIMKVLLLEEPEILDEKIKLLPKEIINEYHCVKSLPMCLEVLNKECNKGVGLKALIEKLDIKPEEIIAIGDEGNDYEMIEFAGLGVAMGNANPKIKEIASYITDTNDNHGVAKVIEKFILNK